MSTYVDSSFAADLSMKLCQALGIDGSNLHSLDLHLKAGKDPELTVRYSLGALSRMGLDPGVVSASYQIVFQPIEEGDDTLAQQNQEFWVEAEADRVSD